MEKHLKLRARTANVCLLHSHLLSQFRIIGSSRHYIVHIIILLLSVHFLQFFKTNCRRVTSLDKVNYRDMMQLIVLSKYHNILSHFIITISKCSLLPHHFGQTLDWYLQQLAREVIFISKTLGHYTAFRFSFNTRELCFCLVLHTGHLGGGGLFPRKVVTSPPNAPRTIFIVVSNVILPDCMSFPCIYWHSATCTSSRSDLQAIAYYWYTLRSRRIQFQRLDEQDSGPESQ